VTTPLLEQVLARENLRQAWERVRANRGAPGIDGVSIADFPDITRPHWTSILESLRSGAYRPQPVRRVEIPKAGGGCRPLGIPTVLDRVIQQAMSQVLLPMFDPQMSPYSFAYRPGRSAHDAVRHIQSGIQADKTWAIDLDLSKFFDRVDHDLLMARVSRRVHDHRVLRLIGRYLRSGVSIDGRLQATPLGVPQGGPLSPLLANIMLDDLDQELTRRGHWFARYADDVVILVSSKPAAQRVMSNIRDFVERRLKLVVNETKSRVVRSTQAEFLGFTFPRGKVRWSESRYQDFRYNIRKLTGRSRGISFKTRLVELNRYLRGWMGYFRLSKYFRPMEGIDHWIRRRLRMCRLKTWRYVRTRVSKLLAMGVPRKEALSTGSSSKSCWRLAKTVAVNMAMNNSWFAEQGLVSVKQLWVSFHYPQG